MKKRIICSCIVAMLLLSISINTLAADWVYQGTGSHDLFWGENASVVEVCAALVEGITQSALDNRMGPNSVDIIAAVGFSLIGVLAHSTTGCTVYMETYTLTIVGQPIHYMYRISLVDSNGTVHGPIVLTPNPYSSSSVEDEMQAK